MTTEQQWRLYFFIGVLTVMTLAEITWPRRTLNNSKRVRWSRNLLLVVLNTVAVRILLPVSAISAAELAQTHGWGVFQQGRWTPVVSWLFTLILLDVAIYFQHRAFHAWPPLWRLHRIHHIDLDLDVSTALRFHPVEIILSMLIKVAIVLALGAPAAAVLTFEIILNAAAMFNHGNVALPQHVDRWLRWIVVTPDMHRVHHSVISSETDSNYGFSVSWWDHLFKSYCPQPRDGHQHMALGLKGFRTFERHNVLYLLGLPFRRKRQ